MKRLSLYLFLILFTLQTPSQADDINDFQIEGMSIGDSALDYFSEEEIISHKMDWFKNNKFTVVDQLNLPSSKVYETLQISFKTKDKKFNLHGIEGTIYYKNKIKDCYKKMDEIDLELSEVFKNAKKSDKDTYKHSYDKSGESTITDISFRLNDGVVILACYDWSEKQPWDDHLRISVRTKLYDTFLIEDAY